MSQTEWKWLGFILLIVICIPIIAICNLVKFIIWSTSDDAKTD